MVLIKNKIRTLSGVTPVALLMKAYPCPGKCIYCPTEEGMPQSYLSNEPAVMRAIGNQFDPIKQIWQRLRMYETSGHSIDKIEIIIIGGTFSYYPKNYVDDFIKKIYWALNNYQKLEARSWELGKKYLKIDLENEKRINERAKCRCVGMSIETRPDFINETEIKRLRDYGVTRVELGVQTIDDKILKLIKRGHGRQEIITATRLLKDAGFKICYHLMPNLPGSTPEKDFEVFKEVFENPDFKPDQLKIYPCVLAGKSELQKWFKEGKWVPYDDETLVNLLSKVKSKIIPNYVRIMRLWRDIPASDIEAGSEMSHIRQVISARLKAQGAKCQCIRCREIMDLPQEKKLVLRRTDYSASNGKEIFLEFIDKNENIYGMLRLRIPYSPSLAILKNGGVIRELHVFGQSLNINTSVIPDEPKARSGIYKIDIDSGSEAGMTKSGVQHHGLGHQLMAEAERIVKEEFKLSKMSIISGVGVREYYRQLGYNLQEEYMVKNIYGE